jgi:hypothetical protein
LFVLIVIGEERKFNKTDTWSRAQGSRLDWSLSSSSLRLTLEVVEDVEGDVVVENGVTVAVSADAGDASSTAGTADLLKLFYLFKIAMLGFKSTISVDILSLFNPASIPAGPR